MATRAILHRAYGEPGQGLVLDQVQLPAAGRWEVLVDVHASAVSHDQRLAVQGRPYRTRLARGVRRPRLRPLGTDFAGRITGGSHGGRLRVGDAVFGWCAGAHAEQAIAPLALVALRPSNLTAEQAAVVPSAGTTALRAVRDAGRVGSSDRVLVIGASGGVGAFAVQIAKAYGGEVTGVCSTTNADLVRSIGADHVIDYTRQDLDPAHGRWDVVIDLVGNRPTAELRRHLTRTGTLVLVGHPSPGSRTQVGRRAAARVLAIGSTQRVRPLVPRRSRADLEVLCDLIETGRVTPVVSAHYPLADVATALCHFAPGHARGAIAITV